MQQVMQILALVVGRSSAS